ncbi:hypothetical protein ABPG77_005890 [Micractinium sp. CCAP 211/92]
MSAAIATGLRFRPALAAPGRSGSFSSRMPLGRPAVRLAADPSPQPPRQQAAVQAAQSSNMRMPSAQSARRRRSWAPLPNTPQGQLFYAGLCFITTFISWHSGDYGHAVHAALLGLLFLANPFKLLNP